MNPINKEHERISPDVIGNENHPTLWAFETLTKNRIKTREEMAAPVQSNFFNFIEVPDTTALFLITFTKNITAIIPTGIVRKNMDLQPKALTNVPPIIGPLIDPTPMTDICMPRALPLSIFGNTSIIIAIPFACIAAAATP